MFKQSDVEITKYNDYKYLIYTRVSSDKDSQKESVPNQIDICRYWLEQNHYEFNENAVLVDEDKSGTLFLERTAMQLILQKARNREIKMVLFKSIHRLARDLKDALEIKEVLLGHGVRVVTIEEGYDSYVEGKNDMKFEMFSMFAAQYPKSLSVSISSALAAKVRRGEHIGKIPYGYDRIDQKLVIKEDEANVIRQIYKWYNEEGFGFKKITHLLNKGVQQGEILPPRSGKAWQITSIQRIIKNPTFCGTFILNQYTTIKVDGRKKQIRNPEEKWIVFEDHHPAIVSKEDWKLANNKKKVNIKTKITPWNEFRGLLKCGKCGSNIVIIQSWNQKLDGTKTHWRYLKCSAYRRSGKSGCDNHVPIRYEEFRRFIVERLLETGQKVSLDFNNTLNNHSKQQVKQLENSIAKYQEKSEGLVDLYLDRLIDKVEFQVRRKEFEQQIKEAQDKLFLYKNEEVQEVSVKNIQQAFKTIEKKDQDLYHVLKVIIDYITVNIDGSVDIKYNFDLNK
ncbi:recombinase family protein [Virgibacillus dokdonensis]|uniref:recombinase family protein n=1 Tax=Virgibacillus dokdonensis TaxID=302167 RepID=UPI000989ECC3|nr:recombinase family protein [Virgibacillus dokdonensis]